MAASLAARDGHAVTLITALARDPAGRELAALLAEAGVEVVDLGLDGATPEKVRIRSGGHSLLRLDRGRAAGSCPEVGLSRCRRADSGWGWYCFSGSGGQLTENGSNFELNGKVALVTGAASGLGAATARVFAAHGARVICADLDERGGGKVAKEIGGRAIYLDVAEVTWIWARVHDILAFEGRIDILINSGGVDFIRSATEMTLVEWDRAQHVNLRAPWAFSRAVFPHMVERGGGQIVNVSSTASKKGWSKATAYAASKHGVMGLTQALHAEGKEHGTDPMPSLGVRQKRTSRHWCWRRVFGG